MEHFCVKPVLGATLLAAHLEGAESEEHLRPARAPVHEVPVEDVVVLGAGDAIDGEDGEEVLQLPVDIADDGHLAVLRDRAFLQQAR